MNKIAHEIPNRIKQPALCCIYCGKGYIKRPNLNKHVLTCELLHRSNQKKCIEEDDQELPSQRKLFHMLIELSDKYSKLEEKVTEINKWVVKKKKKINMLEWLNTNITPSYTFNDMNDNVVVNECDAELIIEHSFIDLLDKIFSRSIYRLDETECPIFAFIQKTNVLYIYGQDGIWIEMTKELTVKFLNKVHMKVIKAFYDWRKTNSVEIKSNEKLTVICDKTLLKLMNVDFTNDNTLSRMKCAIYAKLKRDVKSLVEYEFEFS